MITLTHCQLCTVPTDNLDAVCKFCLDYEPPKVDLPDHVLTPDNGHVITTVIAEPGWVYAWHTTDLETGNTWLSVYRSVLITTDGGESQDPALSRRVRDLIGDAELIRSETDEDADMMFRKAELAMYSTN